MTSVNPVSDESTPTPDAIVSILDAFEDPVCVATAIRDREGRILDFRITFANVLACQWVGLRREQLVGRIVAELLPRIRESGVFDLLSGVVDTGQPAERSGLAYADTVAGGRSISTVVDVTVIPVGDGYLSTWRRAGERPQRAPELVHLKNLLGGIVSSRPGLAELA